MELIDNRYTEYYWYGNGTPIGLLIIDNDQYKYYWNVSPSLPAAEREVGEERDIVEWTIKPIHSGMQTINGTRSFPQEEPISMYNVSIVVA